jgi:competence protein ComEC
MNDLFSKNSFFLNNPEQSSKNTIDLSSPELLVLHVDVGQGESTILIERLGTNPVWCCIIDGGFGTSGRGALIRYLKAFKVSVVNLIICSHFDGDHTKGLTELLHYHAVPDEKSAEAGKPFIQKLLVRNSDLKAAKSSTKLRLLKAAGDKKVKIEQAKVGGVDILPPARSTLSCLHANSAEFLDENDGSLAFRLKFGNFSYYTAGDLPSEKELSILGEIKGVDAFKCGHHGSANSTPEGLLKSAQPIAAFISCGRNSFGHPTFDVIERLCAEKSPVQTVYMTNCIHNRRCVNDNFDNLEKEIFLSYPNCCKKSGRVIKPPL